MSEKQTEFREKLLSAQDVSPALRAGYEKERDTMLNPPLSGRMRVIGISVLVILLGSLAAVVRALLFFKANPLYRVGWVVLGGSFAWASWLIVRDLLRGRHSPKSTFSIAQVLTLAAGVLTVVALMRGLSAPSDPKATFGAFYVFVFYVACLAWGLESRIGMAELAAKEQALRIECRLADLAEKLAK